MEIVTVVIMTFLTESSNRIINNISADTAGGRDTSLG